MGHIWCLLFVTSLLHTQSHTQSLGAIISEHGMNGYDTCNLFLLISFKLCLSFQLS